MIYLNRVFLAGRIKEGPEVRYTPAGKGVVFFTLQFPSDSLPGVEIPKEDVTVRVVALAEEGKWEGIGKGVNLLVEGGIIQRRWENDEGVKRRLEVIAHRVTPLEKIP